MHKSSHLLIAHGAAVALVGLLSGLGLLFSILDAVAVWPLLLNLDDGMLGTQAGWQLAHVAGLMNGMLMIICALACTHINATAITHRWVCISMVITGWGNTVFFHLGNLSGNRALAVEPSKLGEPDTLGIIGYIFGAATIPFTTLALVLIIRAASHAYRG